MAESSTEGVYVTGRDGLTLVHAYLNEYYALGDIAEVMQYGKLGETAEGDVTLTLTRKEMRDVQNAAHAFSFDYDEGFVELCLDLARAAAELPGETVTFIEKLQ